MSASEERARDVTQASGRVVRDDLAQQAVDKAMTDRDIEDLHTQMDALRKQVVALQDDRNKALLWGVLTLGGAVVTMAVFIIKLLTGGRP